MAQTKTAISIDHLVYSQMDKLARDLRVSRSRLFELAAKEFVRRHKDEDITKKLNQVYGADSDLDSEEEEFAKRMKPSIRRRLEEDE